MNPAQRFAHWLYTRIGGLTGLAAVTAVPVGLPNDGLVPRPAGSPLDKDWYTLFAELNDAREAWRANPLARRMIGLTTSYTVGHGITLTRPTPHCSASLTTSGATTTCPCASTSGAMNSPARRTLSRPLQQPHLRHVRRAYRARQPHRVGRLRPDDYDRTSL